MPPSLLFDARLILNKPTGIGQYIVSLIPHLLRQAPDWHVHLLRRVDPWSGYGITEWQAPNLTHHVSHVPHMTLQQHLYLPRLARQLGVNLIHYPHFDAPVWGQIPVVATIHDAKYLVHPEFFTNLSRLKRMYMRFCYAQSLQRATVMVDSHSTARDLCRLFNVASSRLTVVHLAADERFQPASMRDVQNLRTKYKLGRPFILNVGELRPHKNHLGLIHAYARSQSQQTHDLVIIGQVYQDYGEPQKLVQELGLANRVHFLSDVPFSDLSVFYTAADLFVLVSFYEGFGLPILEAMACDTPVICSATTAAGEITGEGGLTVDPNNSLAITQQIDTLLQNPALRQQWVAKGREWRQRYTWQQAAKQTIAQYQIVVDNAKSHH